MGRLSRGGAVGLIFRTTCRAQGFGKLHACYSEHAPHGAPLTHQKGEHE